MSARQQMISFISRELGLRDLIWGGLRSDDIELISDLPQVAGSYAIVGGHERGGAVSGLDFEDLSGVRVDLDTWDIEDHLDTVAAGAFRDELLARLARPTALLPYRPSRFLSSIHLARRDRCQLLGLFGDHQMLFEHKPWVETQVELLGIPQLRWRYVADEERRNVERMIARGPVMLRVSRSSGGAGLVRVDDPECLEENWPRRPDGFASVTSYLPDVLPVNIAGTVWHDGVTMQCPSVQMIGIQHCTTRPFGYCGNDFGLAADLDGSVLDAIESGVLALGNWLRKFNYRGTFGVDFLVNDGRPLFAEINARFQGSTHASSQIAGEAGESCVLLDHLGAFLGHDAPSSIPLRVAARRQPKLAHLVVHWTGPDTTIDASPLVSALREQSAHCRTDLIAKPKLCTATGGVVARTTVRDTMTSTGFALDEPWRTCIARWREAAAVAP